MIADDSPGVEWYLDVKDAYRTLVGIAEALCGKAHLSLEGKLDRVDLAGFPGADFRPGTLGRDDRCPGVLGRDTLWPPCDFAILPLEPETLPRVRDVLARIGVRSRVFHAKIERDGRLVFASYDQFSENCCWAGPGVPVAVLERLVASGALRGIRRFSEEP